jgi:hypothetical protein
VRDADDDFDAKPQEDHNNDVLLYMEYLTLLQNQLSATDSPKSDDVKCLERCMARLSKIKDKAGPDAQYCAQMVTIIRDSQFTLAAIAYNYGADALNRSSQTERKNFKAYATAVVCFKKSASAYRSAGKTQSAVETEVMLAETYENYADELFDKKDEEHLLAAIENYQAALKHYPRDDDGKKEFSIKMRLSILNARAELAQQYFASKHYQLALEQTNAGLELYDKRMKALHLSDDDYPETCELLLNLSNLGCKIHAELYKQQQSLRTGFAAKLLACKGGHDLGPPLTWGAVEKLAKTTDSKILGKRKTSSDSAPLASEVKKGKPSSVPSASGAKKGKPDSAPPASEAKKGKPDSAPSASEVKKGKPDSAPSASEVKKSKPDSAPSVSEAKKAKPGSVGVSPISRTLN